MSFILKNFNVFLEDRQILHDINLEINAGKIHALMGPNGSGKSTLSQAVMGNPGFEVRSKKYEIRINGIDLSDLTADQRARRGLFLAFQSPTAIPGVSVANLLRTIYKREEKKKNNGIKSKHNPALNVLQFNQMLVKLCQKISIPQEFLGRNINDNFSGGEKKKLEMLQALVLLPKYSIFDEIDTGLDVDSLKIIAESIDELKKGGTGILIITHYYRILKFVRPDFVHILVNGKLVQSGNYKLALEIERNGYQRWRKK